MNIYLIIVYSILSVVCICGLFNRRFDGDTFQRIGLVIMFFSFIYRAHMLTYVTYSWPHEPPLITGLLFYAGGTIKKTVKYCIRRKRAAQLIRIRRNDDIRTI